MIPTRLKWTDGEKKKRSLPSPRSPVSANIGNERKETLLSSREGNSIVESLTFTASVERTFFFFINHTSLISFPLYVSNQYLSLCHSHILITFCETYQPLREMKHQAASHAVSFSPPTQACKVLESIYTLSGNQASSHHSRCRHPRRGHRDVEYLTCGPSRE